MSEVNLPDFDEIYQLISDIRGKAVEVAKLELEIKILEKDVFERGKDEGLSVTYTSNTYKTTGFDNEIIPKREELAEATADLKFMENTLLLHRSKIEVWRTISANERTGLA